MVDRIAGHAIPPLPSRTARQGIRTEAVAEQDMEARRTLERLFNSSGALAVSAPRETSAARKEELLPHLGRFVDVIA